MANSDVVQQRHNILEWLWSWWIPVSASVLREAEKKIFSRLETTYRGFYVDIGPVVGTADKIWTISLNSDSEKVPLLLLHGLGSGVALWSLNLDYLARKRPVYAIDILGFGRSSRPVFSSDCEKTEDQLVSSIEEWRKEMKLEKFIILGHNMGGFLATAYALKHPKRVVHLILADPWGFSGKPGEKGVSSGAPLWTQVLSYIFSPLNPLFLIRAAGPFGKWFVEKLRPDLVKRFSVLLENDISAISEYIFQCNAQSPTGEAAFQCMAAGEGWAKNPILSRKAIFELDKPLTLLYGSRSWIDMSKEEKIVNKMDELSYFNLQMVSGAGTHMYADKSEIFNKYVEEACEYSDSHVEMQ